MEPVVAYFSQAPPHQTLLTLSRLLRWERWQALSAEQLCGFPPLCPDLVIELSSTIGAGTTCASPGRLHGQRRPAGLAAVSRAAGCGDMPGRWRRDGTWRTPAERAGADAGGWGVVAGVTAGAGRNVEQLKGRAGVANGIEHSSAWISWLQGCPLTILAGVTELEEGPRFESSYSVLSHWLAYVCLISE